MAKIHSGESMRKAYCFTGCLKVFAFSAPELVTANVCSKEEWFNRNNNNKRHNKYYLQCCPANIVAVTCKSKAFSFQQLREHI